MMAKVRMSCALIQSEYGDSNFWRPAWHIWYGFDSIMFRRNCEDSRIQRLRLPKKRTIAIEATEHWMTVVMVCRSSNPPKSYDFTNRGLILKVSQFHSIIEYFDIYNFPYFVPYLQLIVHEVSICASHMFQDVSTCYIILHQCPPINNIMFTSIPHHFTSIYINKIHIFLHFHHA